MPEISVSGRVLIADDDAAVRLRLRRMLEPTGVAILEAENGREAIELARDYSIDIAIVDLVMPEMDGLETIRELLRGQPGINIIAISGALPAHFLDVAKRMGARAVIAKPIAAAKLMEVMGPFLGGKT